MSLEHILPTHNENSQFQLETSVTPKSMGLISLTVEIPSTRRPTNEKRPPPRWGTLEFKLYYVIACVVIPIMFWIPISLSSPSHPNYQFFQSRLSQGWLFNRPIDNSDAQYRSFRNNMPLLIVAAMFYLVAKFIRTYFATGARNNLYLIPFSASFSVLMLLALHGASIVKIFIILTINYQIAKSCRASKLGPLLTWVFNGGILMANEIYHGYRFGAISSSLAFLDGYSGLSRWDIWFNITMLRLVSFNMDYYWACNTTTPVETEAGELSEKQRQTIAHPESMYTYLNYIGYALYPPLYIAGPIMTFNDFLWQHRRPTTITTRFTVTYLIRFIITFLTMEFILHFMYVVAIKDRKAWIGDTPAQISLIGWWNLMIVWLKLLIPWRFFRLWALLDGINPPENMIRCMSNNYSSLGFWRSWHRSYNLWIIRYIYVPLGGAKNFMLNTILVFTFVALWHDLTFRLLAWGWLISLFILPELAASYILPSSKYGAEPWYRHVCAMGAVLNMMMMVIANLVGFVIGIDETKFLLARVFGTWDGAQFLLAAYAVIFVGVQLMFEYREEEMRKGIYRRC